MLVRELAVVTIMFFVLGMHRGMCPKWRDVTCACIRGGTRRGWGLEKEEVGKRVDKEIKADGENHLDKLVK